MRKFRQTRHFKYISNAESLKIGENAKLDMPLSVENNPHSSSLQIAADHGISQRSVLCIPNVEKYHSYQVQLQQQLRKGDSDRRIELCGIMQDLCCDYITIHVSVIPVLLNNLCFPMRFQGFKAIIGTLRKIIFGQV